MKAIFTEGSIHHLKTMQVDTAPRAGDEVIIENHIWIVDKVTHLPKQDGRNDNETCCGWDVDRDADLSIHLVREW